MPPPLNSVRDDDQITCLIISHCGHDYGCTKASRDTHTDAANSAAHGDIPEHVLFAISAWKRMS